MYARSGPLGDVMSNRQPSLPPEIQQALQRGDVLGAIKAIRAAGGVDLQTARRAVEAHLRAQVEQQATAGRRAGRLEDARASLQGSADSTRANVRNVAHGIHRKSRPPTIEMGGRPGEMRWVLVVLGLLAIAVWIAFGGDA